jgi:hypothetical protein
MENLKNHCPSAKSARELIAILSALDAVSPQPEGEDRELAQQLDQRLDSVLDSASWVRPTSAEGALLHLVLGASIAADLARARDPEAQERRAMRHFHAARAYLETTANLPSEWARIFAHAMPLSEDFHASVEARLSGT